MVGRIGFDPFVCVCVFLNIRVILVLGKERKWWWWSEMVCRRNIGGFMGIERGNC